MWEFPLHIMDSYICSKGSKDEIWDATMDIVKSAEKSKVEFLTILFHDIHFDSRYEPAAKWWYEKIIRYCEKKGYTFVNYREAITELESELR